MKLLKTSLEFITLFYLPKKMNQNLERENCKKNSNNKIKNTFLADIQNPKIQLEQ